MFFKRKPITPARTPFAPQLDNGTFDVGSAYFRQRCAVREGGVVLIAREAKSDPKVLSERDSLVNAGRIPAQTRLNVVSLNDVADAYNARALRASNKVDTVAVNSVEVRETIENLLTDLANARASDLDIILRDYHTDLRMKVGGKWHNIEYQWPVTDGKIILDALFNAREEGSGQSTREIRSFQSYSITSTDNLRLPPTVVKLRGERGPHETGGDVGDHHTLRFFYSSGDQNTASLSDLGLDEDTLDAINWMCSRKDGGFVIGGATGDGKSTTLIRAIETLIEAKGGHTKVVSIEDPVEMRLGDASVLQIPVSSSGDGSNREEAYRRALMHFSRTNPDVGLVSEIRDASGGKQVLQFISSGHTVFTTIHVLSANEILFRLISMGIPATEVARPGLFKLLMQQTLVQCLCPECALPYDGSQTLPTYLRTLDPAKWAQLRFRNPDGCPSCLRNYTGVGRIAWAGYERLRAVGEIIEPDTTYLGFVREENSVGALEHWLKPEAEGGLGGQTIEHKVREMVLSGLVDPNNADWLGGGSASRRPRKTQSKPTQEVSHVAVVTS